MSINCYAMDVRVFFTNKSPERFKPVAVVNYVQNGIEYEEYIKPPIPLIEPFAENVKLDIDSYLLELSRLLAQLIYFSNLLGK